jgi:hypothetical protein
VAINKKERNRKEIIKNMKEIIRKGGEQKTMKERESKRRSNESREGESGEREKRVREKEGKGE